jgi:hypothetical protein
MTVLAAPPAVAGVDVVPPVAAAVRASGFEAVLVGTVPVVVGAAVEGAAVGVTVLAAPPGVAGVTPAIDVTAVLVGTAPVVVGAAVEGAAVVEGAVGVTPVVRRVDLLGSGEDCACAAFPG